MLAKQSLSLLTTKITKVNLSAFAYRLFHEDFSSLVKAKFSPFTLGPLLHIQGITLIKYLNDMLLHTFGITTTQDTKQLIIRNEEEPREGITLCCPGSHSGISGISRGQPTGSVDRTGDSARDKPA